MSRQESRRQLSKALTTAAAAYQEADVIPHCRQCSNPCCRLDPLVLELEWKQIKTLWKIEESRASFDQRLCSGKGPQEIRESEGLYFVHGKACPAFDEAAHSCTIYGQDLKPLGCSDFPVYEDEGSVIADLRCEAVDLNALATRLAGALGPDSRIVQSADKEFPFMVTLSVRRAPAAAASGKRRRNP